MSKVAVIYWTGGGNTEAMANSVAEGVRAAGGEADVFFCSSFDVSTLPSYDAVALGCPAMGAEELEDGEFLPFYESAKAALSGKKTALFGSYGWGDGEWMRSWEDDCREAGIDLAAESVICCEAPDADAEENCRNLGKALA